MTARACTLAEATPAHGISVRGVHYRYADAAVPALHDINLDAAGGEIFGLLGPNGAGKSTLLGLLSGSLTLQSGAITIAGEALPKRARQAKRLSAVVPQEYAFYESLTGRQNLDYFGSVFGLSRAPLAQRCAKVIEICRLEQDVQRRAGDYSGGLKRRLNLAIGLLNEPRILYLDEPTVGIDAQSRTYILDAVRELKSAGTTIVYTSHYMEEVERLCDTVAIIDHGRVVLQERMEHLLRREGGQSLQIMLSAPTPTLADALLPFAATHDAYRSWTMELPCERLAEVLGIVERHGARIERMQYGVSRLENIYLALLLNAADDREAGQ